MISESSNIEAVGAEEFVRLLERFAPLSSKIALAVSGGPDSMALALCIKRWRQRDFVALIVEHGLRPESAAEAAQVKSTLQGLGIKTEILPWTHEAVPSRIHEVARDARYDLLVQACHRLGAGDLLLAHHGGDQAETILMRLCKGSGLDGLAGIPEVSERDGIRLLRPFLSLSKDRLIATCKASGISFVTDPSNASEKYARGRLRKIMPLLADEGLTVENLLMLGERAREAKEALDRFACEFLAKAAKAEPGGSVTLDRALLREATREIALRALSASLRYVHDEPHPPKYAALSSLLDATLSPEPQFTRTLFGCIASISEKKVSLLREPRAATEILDLKTGTPLLWDNRWLISAKSLSFPASVRALGLPPHELVDSLAPDLRRLVPQGRVRATLPGLFEGGALRAIPSFDENAPVSAIFAKHSFP